MEAGSLNGDCDFGVALEGLGIGILMAENLRTNFVWNTGLEAEACLYIDRTGTESGCVLTEVGGIDVIRDICGIEIQEVEQVEEIGANLEPCVLSQKPGVGQPEALGQRGVDVAIARTDECVPAYAWRRWRGIVDCREPAAWITHGGGEVRYVEVFIRIGNRRSRTTVDGCRLSRLIGQDIGKVSRVFEGVVTVAGTASTKILGAQVIVTTILAVEGIRDSVVRSSGKSCMYVEYSAQ
jgi:hypothetical protein